MASGKTKLENVQALRGILFLGILLFHAGAPFASMMWGGVESFFVISSFFLTMKYYCNDFSVASSFKNRVKRLYPPYLAVIVIALLYTLLRKVFAWDFIPHLLSCQNYLWMFTGYSSPMVALTAHTWTLSIEVWMDLLWILLLRNLRGKRFELAMILMFICGIAYRTDLAFMGLGEYVISLFPLAHADAFALGSLLAIHKKNRSLNKHLMILLGSIGIVGISGIVIIISKRESIDIYSSYNLLKSSRYYLRDPLTCNLYTFISFISICIVGLCISNNNTHAYIKESNILYKIFKNLGNESYVLYLFHWPILIVLRHVFGDQWFLLFPIVILLSIIASVCFNKILFQIRNLITRSNIL